MVFTSVIIMIAFVVAAGRLARPENIGLFNYLHLDTSLEIILWPLWSVGGAVRGLSALQNAFTQWSHHKILIGLPCQGRNG